MRPRKNDSKRSSLHLILNQENEPGTPPSKKFKADITVNTAQASPVTKENTTKQMLSEPLINPNEDKVLNAFKQAVKIKSQLNDKRGTHTPQDKELSEQHLLQAAESGDADSLFQLARRCEKRGEQVRSALYFREIASEKYPPLSNTDDKHPQVAFIN